MVKVLVKNTTEFSDFTGERRKTHLSHEFLHAVGLSAYIFAGVKNDLI